MDAQRAALDKADHPEAPRIVVNQPRRVVQRKLKMVVARIESARIEAVLPMGQAAGHSKVHEDDVVAVELDDQIFRATRKFNDSPARDCSGKILG